MKLLLQLYVRWVNHRSAQARQEDKYRYRDGEMIDTSAPHYRADLLAPQGVTYKDWVDAWRTK